MNIYLIGYRCTGKTTIGRRVAHKLGRPFVDADAELVNAQGTTITDFVSKCGWAAFRELEKSVLHQISRTDNQVISTGGGVVLDPENIDCMKQNGLIIWLRAMPETVYERMKKDRVSDEQRPSLTQDTLRHEILKTMVVRKPSYEAAMSRFVDTDNKEIDVVCEEVISVISAYDGKSEPVEP